MASKFGGIPVQGPRVSKFGGVPFEETPIQPQQETLSDVIASVPKQQNIAGIIPQIKPPSFEPGTMMRGPQPVRTRSARAVSAGNIPEVQPTPGAEIAATLATGAVAEPLAGLAGIVGTILPGEPGQGARFVEKTREALQYQPKTEGAKEILGAVGKVAEKIPDVGKKLGDFTFELTGDPLYASLASATPTLVAELIGLGALKKLRAGTRLIDDAGLPTKALKKSLEKQGLDFDLLSDQAKKTIPDEATGPLSAGPSQKTVAERALIEQINSGAKDDALAKLMVKDGRVVNDALAQKAVKQGFTDGFVQAVKTSNPETKSKMLKMSEIARKIKKNERLALEMRPSDIVGDSVTNRIKFIRDKASTASKELNNIAKTKLKGQKISGNKVVSTLEEALDDLDITLVDTPSGIPKPEFKGSLISKDRSSQKVIRDLVDIMGEGGEPDALRFHKLKRQLDIMIDFNKKSAIGLSDAGKKVLKKVRGSLNESLRAANPEYAKVNDILSQSIGALDDLDKSVGTIDIFGAGSNKAIGQRMRALLSNQQGRVKIENALNDIESVTKNLGGTFGDDIKDLVMFADGLENRFGTVAKTSLAGQTTQAIAEAARQTPTQAAVSLAGKGIEKLRGVNDSAAFEALENIIRRQ